MAKLAGPLRPLRRPAAGLAALSAGLALPVCCLGAAGSGGVGLNTTVSIPVSTSQPIVGVVNFQVSVQGNGITLDTRAAGQTGTKLQFTGTADGDQGATLEVEYRLPGTKQKWHRATTAVVAKAGTFGVGWKPTISGHLGFRALLAGPQNTADATSTTSTPADGGTIATPVLAVTVFRTRKATWYGGKTMWGRSTACGDKLRKKTLGVANRTLKCGTKVALYYLGHEIIVPVIDRGPYGKHAATWDLTEATAAALKMKSAGVAMIGSLS